MSFCFATYAHPNNSCRSFEKILVVLVGNKNVGQLICRVELVNGILAIVHEVSDVEVSRVNVYVTSRLNLVDVT